MRGMLTLVALLARLVSEFDVFGAVRFADHRRFLAEPENSAARFTDRPAACLGSRSSASGIALAPVPGLVTSLPELW